MEIILLEIITLLGLRIIRVESSRVNLNLFSVSQNPEKKIERNDVFAAGQDAQEGLGRFQKEEQDFCQTTTRPWAMKEM